MKKIILQREEEQIDINTLVGNEIIAYRCHSDTNSHAVLTTVKIPFNKDDPGREKIYGYAFIPLNTSNGSLRYYNSTWRGAIESAIKGNRELIVFKNELELCDTIATGNF